MKKSEKKWPNLIKKVTEFGCFFSLKKWSKKCRKLVKKVTKSVKKVTNSVKLRGPEIAKKRTFRANRKNTILPPWGPPKSGRKLSKCKKSVRFFVTFLTTFRSISKRILVWGSLFWVSQKNVENWADLNLTYTISRGRNPVRPPKRAQRAIRGPPDTRLPLFGCTKR